MNDAAIRAKIRRKEINWAGNGQLKIYGTLHCKSGKRMKRANRVFFASEEEALAAGFRPCGHCCWQAYQIWKYGFIQ
jgi:methylphosphotriester-DNA--protein-cysteine methyltransferase